jgi:hypothetical protein
MPNHVRSVIHIDKTASNKSDVEALFATVFSTDDQGNLYFDFNKLIWMPESLNIESGTNTDTGIALYKAILRVNSLPETDIDRVLNAKRCIEAFSGKTENEVTAEYRQLLKTLHPDVSSHPKANEATAKLILFYGEAKGLIAQGRWKPSFSTDIHDIFNVPGVEEWAIKRLKKEIADANIDITSPDALQRFAETESGKKYYELGNTAITNLTNYGAKDWYDWSIREWGTKWNSYDCEVDSDSGRICLSTAWSCPEPIVCKLAEMYPKVHFKWEYADEDTGCNTGLYVHDDSGLTATFHDNCSSDAYQAYINCWGGSDCLYEDDDGKWQRYDCDSCPTPC